jgi:hypothetical protein
MRQCWSALPVLVARAIMCVNRDFAFTNRSKRHTHLRSCLITFRKNAMGKDLVREGLMCRLAANVQQVTLVIPRPKSAFLLVKRALMVRSRYPTEVAPPPGFAMVYSALIRLFVTSPRAVARK